MYCFTFRSITAAQQAQQRLQRIGIKASMIRTPSELRSHGCGYCLRTASLYPSQEILRQGEKSYQKCFERLPEGVWQEVAE